MHQVLAVVVVVVAVDELQVLGEVGGRLGQIGDRLALDALEVDVATLGLLLLPRHVYERPLHVAVDDLGLVARAQAHLLLVRRIALDAEAELLEAAILEHLFGHVAVLDVLEEAVQIRAVDYYRHNTTQL